MVKQCKTIKTKRKVLFRKSVQRPFRTDVAWLAWYTVDFHTPMGCFIVVGNPLLFNQSVNSGLMTSRLHIWHKKKQLVQHQPVGILYDFVVPACAPPCPHQALLFSQGRPKGCFSGTPGHLAKLSSTPTV